MLTHRLGLLSKPVSPDKLRAQAAKVRRAAGASAQSFRSAAFRAPGTSAPGAGCSASSPQSWARAAATKGGSKDGAGIRP